MDPAIPAFIGGFAALASVTWVCLDASRRGGVRRLIAWSALVLLSFVLAVPLYLVNRSSLARNAKIIFNVAWSISILAGLLLLFINPLQTSIQTRGWGGFNAVSYRLNSEQKRRLSLPVIPERGAVRIRVYAGTPMAYSGLRTEDVVFSIDGRSIFAADELTQCIDTAKPGDIKVLRYFHSNDLEPRTARLTVGIERYIPDQRQVEFRPTVPFLTRSVNGIWLEVLDFQNTSRKLGLQIANLWGIYRNTGHEMINPTATLAGDDALYPVSFDPNGTNVQGLKLKLYGTDPVDNGLLTEGGGLFQYRWRIKLPFVHVLRGERILEQVCLSRPATQAESRERRDDAKARRTAKTREDREDIAQSQQLLVD